MVMAIQSTKIKPGYKQTEVGVIPEEWDVVELGDIIDYIKGFAFKSGDYQSDGVQVIRVSDTTFDSIKNGNQIYIDRNRAYLYDKWALKEYDLVISTVGSKPPMYDSMVGKVIIIEKQYAGALLNQNAVVIRSKSRQPHQQKLLLNHFRIRRYLNYIESIFRGNANQASITLNELFRFQFALPHKDEEQQAIATALSDVDALITSLDKLITKKRNIKQATMQQLLTGKTRLEGFSKSAKKFYKQTEVGVIPEEWEASSWGKLATLEYGKSLRGYENTYGAYPVYGTNGPVGTHTKMLCKHPGVIVGRKGAYRGIHFSKEPFYVIDTAYYLETKEDIDLKWAYYELLTHDINRMDSGSAIPSTSRETFYNLSVIVPPLPEQQVIASVLSDMDAEITALEQKRDKYRALKQGMMQELLTGKTRLRYEQSRPEGTGDPESCGQALP